MKEWREGESGGERVSVKRELEAVRLSCLEVEDREAIQARWDTESKERCAV